MSLKRKLFTVRPEWIGAAGLFLLPFAVVSIRNYIDNPERKESNVVRDFLDISYEQEYISGFSKIFPTWIADSGEADHSFRTDGDHCSE